MPEPLPQPSSGASEKRSLPRYSCATLLLALFLCAALPYINTLGNGFVHDDNNEVLTNPYIRSFGHLKEIFSTRVLRIWAPEESRTTTGP